MKKNPIALLLVVIVLVAIPFIVRAILAAYQEAQMVRETEQILEQVADDLDKRIGEDGSYIQAGPYLDVVDAWGRPLKVTYTREHEHSPQEQLHVRSEGPDSTPATGDDITTSRVNVIGQNILREPARGAVHGLADGIRDLMNKNEDNKSDD